MTERTVGETTGKTAGKTGVNRLRGRSELGVALFLGGLSAVILIDAARLRSDLAVHGPVGPRTTPLVVGTLLAVVAVLLAADVVRGGHGTAETGEDIDLERPSDWPTVLLLAGSFLTNVALIERAGWPISGALMFWGSTFALGSRHLLRDPLLALALSLVTFYAFDRGLGLSLPAGVLEGILP